MKINAYLHFNGKCREAMTFYAEVLGAKITAMMTFEEGGAGDYVPADLKQGIMHSSLEVNGQVIMGSDGLPETIEKVQGMSVCLHPDSVEEIERVFAALSEGGNVTMPLADTGWAERYGQATDRFGTPWMFNYTGKAGQPA